MLQMQLDRQGVLLPGQSLTPSLDAPLPRALLQSRSFSRADFRLTVTDLPVRFFSLGPDSLCCVTSAYKWRRYYLNSLCGRARWINGS